MEAIVSHTQTELGATLNECLVLVGPVEGRTWLELNGKGIKHADKLGPG